MFGRLGRLVAANTEADPRLPAPVAALSGLRVSQIDCGEQHSILVTNKGVVYAWGRNDYEQCIESSSTQQLDLPLQVDLSSVLRPDDVVKQVRAGFRFSACRTSNRVFT
jgi:alpha-tubulin suppressor-like RCC1 family protein